MVWPWLREEHRTELRKIFVRLADYIHRHKITQVIGGGPSAYPYTLAVERAYRVRYGEKARQLRVLNIGTMGEHILKLQYFADEKPERTFEALAKLRPSLKASSRTLVFDDVTTSGDTLAALSKALSTAGVPHKTAVLLRSKSEEDTKFVPHFIGRDETKVTVMPDFFSKAWIGRGKVHELRQGRFARPTRGWLAFMNEVRSELRRISDSVPIKEQRVRKTK